jgi:hypothetical protein
MGLIYSSPSFTNLPSHFQEITHCILYFFLKLSFIHYSPLGHRSKLDWVVRSYHEGRFEFKLDCSIIMNLTGSSLEVAKQLVRSHELRKSGTYVIISVGL